MKTSLWTAAAVAFALMGTAGAAQRGRPAVAWSEAPESRSQPELHAFAACVARGETRRARDMLAMDYRSREYDAALIALLGAATYCAEQPALSANHRFFAARIAEALLLADIRGSDLARHVAFDPARPAIQARDETELMAICTVRAVPDQVAALFATRPASPDESAAIQALMPQVGQCMTAGATGQFNRAAIRSILDLAAYRLTRHNAPRVIAAGRPNLDPPPAR
jgi:hypothetical protein